MPIETDTDRLALLADFGVTASYSGAAFSVIRDTPYMESQGIAGYVPTALARASDVAAAGVAFGGGITIDGVAYTVRGIEPDGTGMTQLILEEA